MIKDIKPDGGNCGASACPHFVDGNYCSVTGMHIEVDSYKAELTGITIANSYTQCIPWAEKCAREYEQDKENLERVRERRFGVANRIRMYEEDIAEKKAEIKYAEGEIDRLHKELATLERALQLK